MLTITRSIAKRKTFFALHLNYLLVFFIITFTSPFQLKSHMLFLNTMVIWLNIAISPESNRSRLIFLMFSLSMRWTIFFDTPIFYKVVLHILSNNSSLWYVFKDWSGMIPYQIRITGKYVEITGITFSSISIEITNYTSHQPSNSYNK